MPEDTNTNTNTNTKTKTKSYVESWDVAERRVDQNNADYNALGATPTEGCANCNWFVSPDACVIVNGDVSPTGMSKFYLPKQAYTPTPLPVTIVTEAKEQEENFITRVIDRVKSALKISAAPSIDVTASQNPVRPMSFIKIKDDAGNNRIRYFMTMTNMFQDKQKEILSSAGHKDYVNWVTESGNYPPLWLWHGGPKSEWGKADWIDYCDGFVCVSGLIHEDKEHIVDALEGQDVAVSHGFVGLMTNKVVTKYRSFEHSVLPRINAANVWTDFSLSLNLNSGELDMPFNDQKRKWLKEVAGLDDASIGEWETALSTTATNLKESGIEWKDDTDTEDVGVLTGTVGQLLTAVKELSEVVKVQNGVIVQLQKSDDEKIAQKFTPQVVPGTVTRPTEKTDNVVEGTKEDNNKEDDWFAKEVIGGMKL